MVSATTASSKIDDNVSAGIYRIVAEALRGPRHWSPTTLADEVINRGFIPSITPCAVRRRLIEREREESILYPIPKGRAHAKNIQPSPPPGKSTPPPASRSPNRLHRGPKSRR